MARHFVSKWPLMPTTFETKKRSCSTYVVKKLDREERGHRNNVVRETIMSKIIRSFLPCVSVIFVLSSVMNYQIIKEHSDQKSPKARSHGDDSYEYIPSKIENFFF